MSIRYLVQALAMLGDLMLFTMIAVAYATVGHDSPGGCLTVTVLALLCLRAWRNHGRFQAWQPDVIRQFLNNAKERGL